MKHKLYKITKQKFVSLSFKFAIRPKTGVRPETHIHKAHNMPILNGAPECKHASR